ncbi:hypothetical protein Ddye_027085 [Dipteronia dyeriana]|uniref:Reverse transcriptase n=1 Tax=Dipteronia dyeriana TaxID=168575 RepID=A0AAD9TNG4_9ROSI|nr:hypothetical protein Ddye_027085 [Dipteronia dyeriana]
MSNGHFEKVASPRPRWGDFYVTKISEKDREDLESVFSVEEVWEALCDCDENNALGPDGLNLNFVKKNWDWIKEYFIRFLHAFYEDELLISDFNCTFIALIPKVKNLESLKDYRPISLVGFMYKVVAKILVNRLKRVMNALIGPTQMAFVKKRQIVDSFVIVEEINFHKLRLVRIGKFMPGEVEWATRSGLFVVKNINRLHSVDHKATGIVKNGSNVVIGGRDKGGYVKEFGSWINYDWLWKVNLRRQLFDWDIEQWKCFKLALDSIQLRDNSLDVLSWSFASSGFFSVSSFKKCLEAHSDPTNMVYDFLWKGQMAGSRCSMCRGISESFDHVFHLCDWSSKLWKSCMGWWDVNVCLLSSIKERVLGWNALCPSSSRSRFWSILFFVIVWSIWEYRNDFIFKGTEANIGKSWLPPIVSNFRFFVDGSSRGNSSNAGISGVLRDHYGKIICLFSYYVGAANAISIEIYAIHMACQLSIDKQMFYGLISLS